MVGTPEERHIKTPTSYQQQIEILKNRGLLIEDENRAITILERINYYRFMAYGLTLKRTSTLEEIYEDGVSFESIFSLYEFDKKLRTLLLEAIESIEIAFRAQIAYHHAHTYGPLAYREAGCFSKVTFHEKFLNNLERSLKENKNELFVAHHYSKYQGQFPIWVAIEVLSFSTLSMLYKNLENTVKQRIAKKYYGVHFSYIQSWLHTLTTIRNIVAHHGRLYGKQLIIRPKIFSEESKVISNKKLFSVFVIVSKLLSPEEKIVFKSQMEMLVSAYEESIDLQELGFPQDWSSYL